MGRQCDGFSESGLWDILGRLDRSGSGWESWRALVNVLMNIGFY